MEDPRLSPYFNKEMDNHTDDYASFVGEIVKEALKETSEIYFFAEQQVDYSEFVPEGFGTADALLLYNKTIHIVDFKYGQHVFVECHDNPQMMLYALGAVSMFDDLFDFETIRMSIFQPRMGNISTFELTKEELLTWAEKVVRPAAKRAFEGIGEFVPGEHCRFCRVRSTCRAKAEQLLALEKHSDKEPPLLTEEEIEEVLGKIDNLVSWANQIKDYALTEAIRGHVWPNYKLVEGRSNRKFSDEEKVVETLTAAGFEPYRQELKSITDLQKQVGKEKLNELVGAYIVKPAGKPTLVPRSDKREEINSAATDFAEPIE